MLSVRIITKEYGKITLSKEEWMNFNISKVNLHSLDEPAYIEYYETYRKVLWLCDNQYHRAFQPASYCISIYDGDLDDKMTHEFFFKDNMLYLSNGKPVWDTHIFNIDYYLRNNNYNLNIKKQFDDFMKDSKNATRIDKIKKLYTEW